MKDGKFETQAEIYQALLDGKKLCSDNFKDGEYVELKDGLQVNKYWKQAYQSFSNPDRWRIYQELKQKVKIVAHLCSDSAIYFSNEDSSLCRVRDNSKDYKRLSLSFDAEVL